MEQTIPDYFSGSVLLRTSPTYPHTFTGELRFQTLFNIVVIWMAVFIGLSKGLATTVLGPKRQTTYLNDKTG